MRKQFFIALLITLTYSVVSWSAQTDGKILGILVEGSINPASAQYIVNGIDTANSDTSIKALLIEMDTPGGLDTAMRDIIKAMQASSVPIIVYVSPSGSRAASAGAFITIASHIAAMTPGTNIGAASPVSMGGASMDETMKKKVMNDAKAYIHSLAESHGRNAMLAEKFVTEGESISEKEALEKNIIDVIATSVPDLIEKIEGMEVKTSIGITKIALKGLPVEKHEMSWRERFLDAIANPNIAYILMMLGFYGLFFELSSPGSIFPGVIGAVSIILAFYSMQALPINYAGALLILIGTVMFLLELWVTSFGLLTLGGAAVFLIGSLMLIDSPAEYFKISIPLIILTTLATASFFFFLIGSGIRAQFRKPTTGEETIIGLCGDVESPIAPNSSGKVFVNGELWDAKSDTDRLNTGDKAEVVSIKGLMLKVALKK